MQGSSVCGIAPLDLFVKLPDILKTQDYWSGESHLSLHMEGIPSAVVPTAVYLDQHEVVKAAVHHQPQWAGRHLSAWTFPDILGFSSLLLLLLLMILPLQPTLLLPFLSSLPAAQSTGPILYMGPKMWHCAADSHIVVKYLFFKNYTISIPDLRSILVILWYEDCMEHKEAGPKMLYNKDNALQATWIV